jgi:ElaB/YqjD/DUF883 family membrane-anchored ribosome-binding protein
VNQDHTSTTKSRSGSPLAVTAGSDADILKSQTGDGLSDSVRGLAADMANLKDTIARLISQAGGNTSATMRNVGQSVASQVGNAATSAAEAGSDLAAAAKDQAKTFATELEGMARRNPLGALAGALVVGVVIGMMSRGRG